MAPSSSARRQATRPAGSSGRARRPARRRSFLWRFRRLFFLLGLLLVAGLAGTGYVLANVPLPPLEPPLETTFIYDANGNKLAELSGGVNRTIVTLDQVSPHLVDAVLAAEDRDFFTHPGIDASAVLRATWANLRGKPLQGGSSITQQYVKLVYTDRQRTLLRKLKEATLAVKLERQLDKEEILERYLNTIYFGRGAYGVQAAAKAYFNTSAGDLEVHEAAYLAGLIRAPEGADATTHPEVADRRRDSVLRALEEEGHLSAAQRTAIAAVPVASYVRPRGDVVQDKIAGLDVATHHVVEHVRQVLAERYGDARVNGGGLRVYTTVDMGLQRAAYEAVYQRTLNRPDDPAGALVSIDRDGRIKAMVGGRALPPEGPGDAAEPPAHSRVNFAIGRQGGGSGRQPGSTFKAFALAEAVRQGYTVESAFDSPARMVFPGLGTRGGDYVVENYEGAAYGRLNLIDATRVSSNTVYAQLAEKLGPDRVLEAAADLGVSTELDRDRVGLSAVLGSAEVSVLDMAHAYLTFATRGMRVEPTIISRVTDAEGRVIDEFGPERERVLEPEHADVVNFVLRQVVENGTGRRAALDTPVAGKTGTTQGYGDAWFVGYTPGLSTAVWIGYPEGNSRKMRSVHGGAVSGGGLPAEVFRRFMATATEDSRYRGSFVAPSSFAGKVLTGDRQAWVDPDQTTTTVPPEDTTTTTDPSSTSTTEPQASTTTTAADGSEDGTSTTSTSEPPPSSTTTQPSTTTTTEPPPLPRP